MTRASSLEKPSNANIVSIQLDDVTHAKLRELAKDSRMSMSRIVRLLIIGASVNRMALLKEREGEVIRVINRPVTGNRFSEKKKEGGTSPKKKR